MKQYLEEWGGSIELIKGRKVHVRTPTGGYDKMVLTYLYECQNCEFTAQRDGLAGLDRVALTHKKQEHTLVIT